MRGKENGHQPRLLIYIYIHPQYHSTFPAINYPAKFLGNEFSPFFPSYVSSLPSPPRLRLLFIFPLSSKSFPPPIEFFFYSSFYRPLRLVSIRFGRDLRISGVVKNKERLGNLRFSKDNREGDGDCRRGRRTTIERGLS